MILPWRPVAIGDGPPIQTSLTPQETAELSRLADDGDVLEIGAAYGYSTVVLARSAAHVITVDPHTAHDSLDAWARNMTAYDVGNVIDYVEASQVCLPRLEAASFTLVFIDGDHTAAAVEHDITQALRLVEPGGHIAVHDYGEDTCPDVRPVCDRLLPGGTLTDTLWVWPA